jgi:hypothetical protein
MDYGGNAVKEWAGDSQWRACCADFARFRTWGKCGWDRRALGSPNLSVAKDCFRAATRVALGDRAAPVGRMFQATLH